MEFNQIERDIISKNFKPIYLFMGEEPFYIDKLTNLIEQNALKESEKSFNQTIVYGKEIHVNEVVMMAKRFPMMAERQVLIIKEAQELKKINELENYLENPAETTILVLAHKYKKVDKRSKLYKLIAKKGICFTSEKVKDYKLNEWIIAAVKNYGLTIEPKAVNMLSEFIGSDISRISNELNKLKIILPKGEKITDKLVEKNIGISKDYNVFELINAISDKNYLKANKILNYFEHNPKAGNIVLIISNLFSFYQRLMKIHFLQNKSEPNIASQLKVHPYVAKQALRHTQLFNPKICARNISYLAEYDLKSKGIGNTSFSNSEILKELIFKLMH